MTSANHGSKLFHFPIVMVYLFVTAGCHHWLTQRKLPYVQCRRYESFKPIVYSLVMDPAEL